MTYMILLSSQPELDPAPGTPAFDAMMAEFATVGDATAFAAALPVAKWGSIEIRPVMDVSEGG